MTQPAVADAAPPGETTSGGRRLAALQLACGCALLAFLARQALQADGFERLTNGEKNYGLLAGALAALSGSVALSFFRWRLVGAAAGVRMTVAEAVRLGAIGFAANFVALGNIGGDLVKAALIAKRRPGSRALAVTTVVVDRIIGLYALLVFASAAILATGAVTDEEAPAAVRLLCGSALVATALATCGFSLALAPGRLLRRLVTAAASAPRVRSSRFVKAAAASIRDIGDAYDRGRRSLAAAAAIAVVCDALIVVSVYLVAVALPMASPNLADHFIIVPLGLIAGAIPISPSGLGTVESTVEALYRAYGPPVDGGATVRPGDGALVAFGHRLVMMAVGAAAAAYYFATGSSQQLESVNAIDGESAKA